MRRHSPKHFCFRSNSVQISRRTVPVAVDVTSKVLWSITRTDCVFFMSDWYITQKISSSFFHISSRFVWRVFWCACSILWHVRSEQLTFFLGWSLFEIAPLMFVQAQMAANRPRWASCLFGEATFNTQHQHSTNILNTQQLCCLSSPSILTFQQDCLPTF